MGTPDDVVFDEDHDHIRARQIGELLDQLGSMELMLVVHDRVRQELGPIRARELEACWGGVGHWMR